MDRSKLVAAGLLVAVAGAACAQRQTGPSLEQRFQRLDADRNGAVTWAEAYNWRVQEFADMDRSRDGLVEPDEFGQRAQPFAAFDADGDGRLQLAEYLGQHHTMFSRFDGDGDKQIQLGEFEQAQQAVRGSSGSG